MSKKNLENDFSSFEQYYDMPVAPMVPAEEPDFSVPEMDFKQPAPPSQPAQETVMKSTPEPEPPTEEMPEPEPLTEEIPAAEPIVHKKPPHSKRPPLTGDYMTRLSTQLELAIADAVSLHDQMKRMAIGLLSSANKQQADAERIRLPKGLRTTLAYLNGLTAVLIATKAIIDIFLELAVEPLYQSVDDSGLKTATASTINTFHSHVPTMQEGLNDIEKAMSEGYDRPSANLRMRIVKAQAKMTQSLYFQQARALAQTIEAFPLENGALRVLCLLQEKGDQAMMNSMDKTMEIAEHVQVPVADAPAMLEAVRNNDQKTVDAIIRKKLLTPNS